MSSAPVPYLSRRMFLQQLAGTVAFTALAPWGLTREPVAVSQAGNAGNSEPWFRRTLRWGQTNLTEIDPLRFDVPWWRSHWKRTHVQGVVVNAGGIVAYYPTKVAGHRRALHLGSRDLFGEIRRAAGDDGLAVLARMDSNRADAAFYQEHPDWFARDADGKPYVVTGLYVACVNSPYYFEHIPAILREVAHDYRPDGFTDNNWNGPMRDQPCFCSNCERLFRARSGEALPRRVDWNSQLYREWILWNYERRLEIWDQFNAVTREAGGADCLWIGMMAGSQSWQARVFRDDREIYRRTELVMLDHQRRFDGEGFQHNGEVGKRIRSVGGWDKIIPESMAMYHLAEHNFRLAAKPEPEVRLWVLEGIAGGVQPWWHHVGAVQPDRRMLATAEPLWRWHRDHERYLVGRRPIATVGLVWSQRNMDFFGRDEAGAHVDEPWNGWMQAMIRARIPYLPVHVDDIERETAAFGLKLLILPNLAAMSDAQAAAVRRFVERGGNLIGTGVSALCNEWGDTREDFALADLFGVHVPRSHAWHNEEMRTRWAKGWQQTYLRLPSNQHSGPTGEASRTGGRHEVLRGFEHTDLIAFGGTLEAVTVDGAAAVPLTFVPPVSTAPAEAVWMREPETAIPGLVLSEGSSGGRVAYLPADIDRRFARENLPDHGDLLANVIRWAVNGDLPMRVEGAGLVDCHLYGQADHLVLHLVNLTNAGTWRTPVHELIPIGPLRIAVRSTRAEAPHVESIVTDHTFDAAYDAGWINFTVPRVLDHEVLVIT